MPAKTVSIKGIQGDKFRMEITAGSHTLVVDQPVPMGGEDGGPNPLEYELVSLAGCIGAIGRIIANQRKMDVRGFRVEIQGEMDTDALLGMKTDQRAGFRSITVLVDIDADMTAEEKRAYLAEIDSRCPVSDNLASGTDLSFRLM